MKFEQFYSSSAGNLYMLTANNGKRLMLECGATWAKIQKALNYDLSNIVGCLLSHFHKDHSKAIDDVLRAGINVYATKETFEGACIDFCIGHRTIIIENKVLFHFGNDIGVLCFSLEHDAPGTLGFIVRDKDEFLLFAPDTSHIKQRFNISFSIIALECSYDKDILSKRVDSQEINKALAKRLLNSHMEKQTTMRYLAEFCDLSKCREIHLLHLSKDNIARDITVKEFQDKFFIKTVVL